MLHTLFLILPENQVSSEQLIRGYFSAEAMEVMCCSVEIFLCTTCIYHRCAHEMRTIDTIIPSSISTKYIFHSEIFFCSRYEALSRNQRNPLREPRSNAIYSTYHEDVRFMNFHDFNKCASYNTLHRGFSQFSREYSSLLFFCRIHYSFFHTIHESCEAS